MDAAGTFQKSTTAITVLAMMCFLKKGKDKMCGYFGAVAVFAVESDAQTTGGLNRSKDFDQPRQNIFEDDWTGQREVQVFRKSIVLKPAAP